MTFKPIYLDNAATSFPKPPAVPQAMLHYMNDIGANAGRGGHALSLAAERIVRDVREGIAALFNIADPDRIVFTLNVTESINTVIYGFLKEGDHVLTTSMEHNAVMRPLEHLAQKGVIRYSAAPCDRQGFVDIDRLRAGVTKQTRLVIVNHASNVCGTLQDIDAVRSAVADIPILLDAAQTAGCVPIDVRRSGIDFLAFTGHKGLLGPQGTGGLYIREGLRVQPLKRGGTGSRSEALDQPAFLPDALESGTRNNVGIAGLGAGVAFIRQKGVDRIRSHEQQLTQKLLHLLHDAEGVTIYGPLDPARQTATVSLTFDSLLPGEDPGFTGCGAVNLAWMEEGMPVGEAGRALEKRHDILVRHGLHCAPMAHRTIGTYPEGTLRISIGCFNTGDEITAAARAVRQLAHNGK